MKLVNEKGKLFGLINVVDLACLLIILLVAAGLGWRLLGSQVRNAVAPSVSMTTTFRIRGAQPPMMRELERLDLVGQTLVSGTGYVEGASITSIRYEPYVQSVETADGTLVISEDPYKTDVIITVESSVSAGVPILRIGNQEVRAGRTFIFKTRTFETTAQIDSVVVHE